LLRIHTKDGRTRTLDLSDRDEAREWVRLCADSTFQASISGLTLASAHRASGDCSHCGARVALPTIVQYSVSNPRDFRRVEMTAEDVPKSEGVNGGERVIVFADDVRLSTMAHASNPALRIVMSKVGRRKFDPSSR
jgi:hypothetical protein